MKQKPRSPHKRKSPKTHLRLPDLEFTKTAVLNSLTSRDGQRGYLGCKQRIRSAVNDRIGIEPNP